MSGERFKPIAAAAFLAGWCIDRDQGQLVTKADIDHVHEEFEKFWLSAQPDEGGVLGSDSRGGTTDEV